MFARKVRWRAAIIVWVAFPLVVVGVLVMSIVINAFELSQLSGLHLSAYLGDYHGTVDHLRNGESPNSLLNSRVHGYAVGTTPLMIAADRNNPGIAALLISSGADPSIRNKDGLDAMHFASEQKLEEMLELLRIAPNDSDKSANSVSLLFESMSTSLRSL